MTDPVILTELRGDGDRRTALVRLNRPKQLNALNDEVMDALGEALRRFDADPAVGAIVVTGSDKAFAAGADIGMLSKHDFISAYTTDLVTRNWETIRSVRKPVIAAVAGFALGGGCELAMMCDIIVAADNARFGQPEIKLGVIPGAGGTQRLPRAVGKAKAMDLVLTGRMMSADEAERSGLVSRVVPADKLLDEVMAMGELICTLGTASVLAAKECVNRAYETPLAEGMMVERRMFHALFGTPDQKEGMDAFLAKRPAKFVR